MPWPCSTQGRNPGKIVTFLPFMIPIPKGDSSNPLLSRVSLIPSWANSLHFNTSRHCSLIVRRLFFGLQQKPVLCCMTKILPTYTWNIPRPPSKNPAILSRTFFSASFFWDAARYVSFVIADRIWDFYRKTISVELNSL